MNTMFKTQGTTRKATNGFSLIELLFVLVIIGVLVALAYPSYVDYVRKGKRGEAQHLLMNWSVNQEIYRSNNTSYAAQDNADLPAPTHSEYGFTTSGISPTTYTLTATASGDQVNDKAKNGDPCNVLTVDYTGSKSPEACWRTTSGS